MKISDIEKRINASYNTIKRFIEKNPEFNHKINNVLHATDLGLQELESKYGVRSEVLSEDNVDFYKNQIIFLRQQLAENKEYNNLFMKQIETKEYEAEKNEISSIYR